MEDLIDARQPPETGLAALGEPPIYESAPPYSAESFYKPVRIFHFRQVKHHFQMLVPYGPDSGTRYEIVYKSATSLLSRKGDIHINRITRTTAQEREDDIARMDFHSDGPIPWCLRARFATKRDGTDLAQAVEMCCENFNDWSFALDGTD